MQPGDKVGRLTAIQFLRTEKRGKHTLHFWRFRCDCGAELSRVSANVIQSFHKGSSPCCNKCRRPFPPKTEPKRLDLAGQKLGKLTAIEPTGRVDKKRYSIWRFQCECGDIFERSSGLVIGNLRKGLAPNCGKQSCNNFPKLEPGQAVKKHVKRSYRTMAKSRGFVFELPDAMMDELFSGRCHYCGTEPRTVARKKDMYGEFIYNGIDRVDNTKGYIPGNVVSCCIACNRAKSTMTYEDFMTWVKRITHYQSTL